MITNARKINKKFQASLSLLASCLIIAITLVSLTLYRGAKQRNLELTFDRLLSLHSEQILAQYDRGASERYGIWAYSDEILTAETVVSSVNKTIPLLDFDMRSTLPLTDASVLTKQITAFSTTRVAVSLFEEIWQRIKMFQEAGDVISGDLQELENLDEITRIPSFLSETDLLPPPSAPVVGAGQSNAKFPSARYSDFQLIPTILEKKYTDSLEEENEEEWEILDFFRKELEIIEQEGVNSGFVDSNTTSSSGVLGQLINLLSQGVKWLQFDFPQVVDKFFFQEYIIQQFSSAVRGPAAKNDSGKNQMTLSGQKMSDLSFSGNYEAESILLNIENQSVANGVVTTAIGATRLALNLAAILNDATKMASYDAIATSIVTAVAILSVGSVLLEPVAVSRVLAVIDAARLMFKDVKALKKGEGVALFPLKGNPLAKMDVFYSDYLRICGLLIPLEKQSLRAAMIIQENIGSTLVCGGVFNVAIQANGRSREIRKEWSYAILAP